VVDVNFSRCRIFIIIGETLNFKTMAKSQDARKETKKPSKTTKEKQAEKRAKKEGKK